MNLQRMTVKREHPRYYAYLAKEAEQGSSRPAGMKPATERRVLEDTVAFWQPRSGRVLNKEDARQILENMRGFFEVLDEWDRAEQAAAKRNHSQSP